MTMIFLSAILRYMNLYNYSHREDLPILITNFFENNPDITEDELLKFIKNMKSDFFYLNNINKIEFSYEIYELLKEVTKKYDHNQENISLVKSYIEKNFIVGINSKNENKRSYIIDYFQKVNKPHEKLMDLFNIILQKIDSSYQINLHGIKEYSGVDIVKKYKNTEIGFQIKSKNDDISEDRIRAQTSKSIEQGLDAFILIYGRKNTQKTSTSIQMAYHYFKNVNKNKKIFCFIITPEIFAELLIIHNISINH